MREIKTYMERSRDHNREMLWEFIGGCGLIVVVFGLMIVALIVLD